MNKLKAEISEISSHGELSLVTLICEGEKFSSLIINNGEDYIQSGSTVFMVFKETEVSIGKGLIGKLSIRNKFLSKIQSVERGKILSEIKLNFKGQEITSIITTGSCESLDLNVGDEVEGLLKTNELLIMRYQTLKN